MISYGFSSRANISLWMGLSILVQPCLIKYILFTQSSKVKVGYSSHRSVLYSFLIGFVCVVALLCGRTAKIYKELFSVLDDHAKRLNLKFEPKRVTSDFEKALIKTVAEEVKRSDSVN
jgi:hypothetical protein